MMPEDIGKMMLEAMLPLKFDVKIKLTTTDKEDLEHHLQGDVFTSKLKGETEDRIFIAIKLPGEIEND